MQKILIVEDDIDIQDILKNHLIDVGYEVAVASDGVAGIAMFDDTIDLVLLDIIPSPSAGTVRNSLCYGGRHGLTCPTVIWNAPGGRNALTTAAMPHEVLTKFLPSMRA